MAPLKVIDYVIIHELVHTIHKNHSVNFWNAVEAIMPNYKEAKLWLKENGYKLRTL
jgi:predicted metal-dependent hydrolase